MKHFVIALLFMLCACITTAQNTGVGIATPAAKLEVNGTAATPMIPGSTSSGIFRIGVSENEGIDFGKMGPPLYTAWIQAGYLSSEADPISLQPLGGNVGIGTTAPSPAAALDISSTSKGFLPPRLTLSQINGMGGGLPEGLTVWCKDCGAYGQMRVFNGALWTNMTGGPALGAPYIGLYDAGGIIGYIFQPGDPGYVSGETHGIITAVADLGNWGWGCQHTDIPGAEGIAIGTGLQNTYDFMQACFVENGAAKLCGDLFLEGYWDWHLPSKDELNKLYLNRYEIGGYVEGGYWSSSEINATDAWGLNFANGNSTNHLKDSTIRVRPVRYF